MTTPSFRLAAPRPAATADGECGFSGQGDFLGTHCVRAPSADNPRTTSIFEDVPDRILGDFGFSIGLAGTALARAQADTIRTRLLKIVARITVSWRRICIAFASVYPLQRRFAHVLAALRAPPTRDSPA